VPIAQEEGERQRTRRYERVLDAAAAVFAEKGYAAASMQDIATRAGILKGSLYHYISTKEDLLNDVMGGFHEGLLAGCEEILGAGDGDPLADLRRLIEAHVVYNASNRVRAGVCYNEFRSLGPKNWAQMLGARDRYERLLRQAIEAARDAGQVRANVDAKVAAFAILGALNTLHHWYREDGAQPPKEIARAYADVFLSGIAV
jgi:AcrR family transcriptional regulator